MNSTPWAEQQLKEMACLTVGADYWKTVEAQGIRPLKMCDGPFGVRHEDPTSASPDGFNQHDSYPATCLPCGLGNRRELEREAGGAGGSSRRS